MQNSENNEQKRTENRKEDTNNKLPYIQSARTLPKQVITSNICKHPPHIPNMLEQRVPFLHITHQTHQTCAFNMSN